MPRSDDEGGSNLPALLGGLAALITAIGGAAALWHGQQKSEAANSGAPPIENAATAKSEPTQQSSQPPPEHGGNDAQSPPADPYKIPGHMGEPLKGIDFFGQDLGDAALTYSEDLCRKLCEANENCVAVTYVKEAFAQHGAGECWQKGAIPKRSPNDYTISAIKNPD